MGLNLYDDRHIVDEGLAFPGFLSCCASEAPSSLHSYRYADFDAAMNS